jgi:hypothetical protein
MFICGAVCGAAAVAGVVYCNRKKINSFIYLFFFDYNKYYYRLKVYIYYIITLKGFLLMDTRLVVIAAPLLVAVSWALFNIVRLAIQQIQRLGR